MLCRMFSNTIPKYSCDQRMSIKKENCDTKTIISVLLTPEKEQRRDLKMGGGLISG